MIALQLASVVVPALLLGLPSEACAQAAASSQASGNSDVPQTATVPSVEPAAKTAVPDIVITARRRAVDERIDRTVYNIAAGPEAASSSTLEVLKRLPGVFVGPSGGVTIRGGSRVAYLVDGKPTRREIAEAIPAGQIERVEIIANPPAEYDSSSEALINIVLKRDAKGGWSGTASGGVDTLGGFRAGMDAALGTRTWKFNGSLSYRSAPLESNTTRETEFAPVPPADTAQTQAISTEDHRRTERLGFQLKAFRRSAVDNTTSILFGGSYNRIPEDQTVLQTLQNGTNLSTISLRRQIDFSGFYPYATVSATRSLSKDTTLDLGLQFNQGNSQENRVTTGDILQTVVDRIAFSLIEPSLKISRRLTGGLLSVGMSYSFNPVSDKLGLGNTPSANAVTTAYDFGFGRNILGAYVEYEGTVLGLGFKPSVRYEDISQSFSNFDVEVPGLRHVGRLLPSLHLSKTVGDRSTVKASFTSKTDRPDGLNLNPFVQVISPFFVRTGNPFLRPSVKRQIDFNYVYEKKGLSIAQTLYYKSSHDDISGLLLTDDTGLTTDSYTNLGSSQTYGYNVTSKGNVTENLQYGLGVDIFHRDLTAPTALTQLGHVSFTSVNANGTMDYKIDARTSFSSQLTYVGPVSDISVRTPRYLSSELQIRRDLGHRITASLLLADVGIPLERVGRFNGLNLRGTERTLQKTRLARLSISTKF